MDIDKIKSQLEQYATNNEIHITYYKVNPLGNCCDLNSRHISINERMKLDDIYDLTHEIGHFKSKKISQINTEILAWIIGFGLCLKFNVPLKGFLKRSIYCLKTYVRKKH